jgi:DNA-binding transcriptional ArsR family regulator
MPYVEKYRQVLLCGNACFVYFIGMSRFIDQRVAVRSLAALAQDTRMTAFRRLVAVYPDSIGAGDIARCCKVPQNTMSTHLAILTRAGLLRVERDGRKMNYQAGPRRISCCRCVLGERLLR